MAAPYGWTKRQAIALAIALSATSAHAARWGDTGPITIPDAQIEPTTWSELDGWSLDDQAEAYATFWASCRPMLKRSAAASRAVRPISNALETACRHATTALPISPERARKFFEEEFRPVRISRLGETQGFLTGYYEPLVEGSRFPTREFTVPMYRRPDDLVAIGSSGSSGFPNKAQVGRRTGDGSIVPYYDRGEIEDGALDGRHLEICWLKDPVAAFSIHIQGSARVRLEDGLMLRLNYDAHNGHSYTPVGRLLIERNIVPKEEMSLERIRQWMHDNPDGARDLRRNNQSFVFFRIVGLGDEGEALGGQGVRLTPGRSIAVDRALHTYGTPFWIEADLPIASRTSRTPFRRLMIAQDTGSAIVGPARADLFFGAGDSAGLIAGRIRDPGRFVMLIPRELDPLEAGKTMPVPVARPNVEKMSEPSAGNNSKHASKSRRAK
ncbi:MAG TPA: MltA domain-containing protein, partial [Xanthobacteraceae bacterium]|nr:MltA domain-containing protein [Xanthobacteraceae bacterium]